MEQFCKSLPKLELHAHLNGSLSKETLISLGVLESNVKEYQKLTEILTKSSRTLDECFKLFDVAHNATNNCSAVYKATKSVISEFYDNGTVYLELRTTPRSGDNMTKYDYIQSVLKAINDSSQLPIIVKLILCLNRNFDSETSSEVMNLIIKQHNLHPDVIVGVDLCGNPKVGYFPKDEFKRAREAGLKVTLHCAEVKGDKEEIEMLEFCPERLGHGTFLPSEKNRGNEETFNVEKLKTMPLEICLSSNIICGTVESYDKHHIRKWIKNKLPFCLCTDDKGVFMCDLSREYFLAHVHYNMSAEDLYNVSYQAIDYIFAKDDIKIQLQTHFTNWKAKHLTTI